MKNLIKSLKEFINQYKEKIEKECYLIEIRLLTYSKNLVDIVFYFNDNEDRSYCLEHKSTEYYIGKENELIEALATAIKEEIPEIDYETAAKEEWVISVIPTYGLIIKEKYKTAVENKRKLFGDEDINYQILTEITGEAQLWLFQKVFNALCTTDKIILKLNETQNKIKMFYDALSDENKLYLSMNGWREFE